MTSARRGKGAPILVACFSTGATAPMAVRETIMGEIGRAAAEAFA
jgi:hypothetical protein